LKIAKVSVGSVIIDFAIKSSGGSGLTEQQKELEKVKAQLDQSMKTGAMNMYLRAKILNYESSIVTVRKFFSTNLCEKSWR